MKKITIAAAAAVLGACIGWTADWPGPGGSPQRDGWARAEKAFTKENASKIEFLYKYKAENQARGGNALTAPVVNGFMITHLGFKEMVAFAGSGDNVFSVDADLNRIVWKVHFDYKGAKPQVTASTALCPGGLTSQMAMPGSAMPVPRGGGGARGAVPQLMSLGNFGRAANFAVIGSDGLLHILNSSTGGDRTVPISFVPPNAKVSAITVINNAVYVATQDGCGGNANAIYGLDLTPETRKPVVFETGGSAAGVGGTSAASDGTIFAQIPEGKSDVAGAYNDTVLAFSPDLKVKDYFTPAGAPRTGSGGATPMVFTWKTKEYVVAGGRDGSIYLLDAKAPGGPDHHTPLASVAGTGGAWTSLASWEEDNNGPRWIYATSAAGVTAYMLEDRGGKAAITQKWTSKEMQAPAAAVTANGLVFSLSTGQAVAKKAATRAVLHVMDAMTGQELYNSGNMTAAYSPSGLAVANRRIYFTTHDNTLYCLGFLSEQPQLTGK